MKRGFSILLVVSILSGVLLGGCGTALDEPTPVPTATPKDVGVADPARACDAVLTYLAEAYGAQAPGLDLDWSERETTPEGLVGSSSMAYTAGEWVANVTFPIVAPEMLVYQVTLHHSASGFRWQGEVDADGQVTTQAVQAGETDASEDAAPVSEAELAELAELVAGNGAFAFDLYQRLRSREGNLFYSPYSLSLALAMTYAGARGETEAQMAQALHFTLPPARLHLAFQTLDRVLAGRGTGEEGFRLNVVNALWGQEGYPFLPAFLEALAQHYGAGLRLLDFAAPEAARVTINEWVSAQTEGRITDLIPPGALDALTRLVLTNAIYFNAAWATPFAEVLTAEGPFHRLDGSEVRVLMMRQTGDLAYFQGQSFQAVELPYEGRELSMVILLPDAGEFEAFEAALDAERLADVLSRLGQQNVALAMPKFEFTTDFSVKEMLAALGMPLAFTGQADFGGMVEENDLFISDVLHKAFVAVDEAGTEAAAATAVIIAKTALPESQVALDINRPFIFVIRDIETGTLLFVGRVVDPQE